VIQINSKTLLFFFPWLVFSCPMSHQDEWFSFDEALIRAERFTIEVTDSDDALLNGERILSTADLAGATPSDGAFFPSIEPLAIASSAFTGPWSTTKPVNLYVQGIGSQISVAMKFVPATVLTNDGSASVITSPVGVIPAWARPTGDFTSSTVPVIDGTTYKSGQVRVSTAGTITVSTSADPTATFAGGSTGNGGWLDTIGFTYSTQ
jgi:hypothetical protein